METLNKYNTIEGVTFYEYLKEIKKENRYLHGMVDGTKISNLEISNYDNPVDYDLDLTLEVCKAILNLVPVLEDVKDNYGMCLGTNISELKDEVNTLNLKQIVADLTELKGESNSIIRTMQFEYSGLYEKVLDLACKILAITNSIEELEPIVLALFANEEPKEHTEVAAVMTMRNNLNEVNLSKLIYKKNDSVSYDNKDLIKRADIYLREQENFIYSFNLRKLQDEEEHPLADLKLNELIHELGLPLHQNGNLRDFNLATVKRSTVDNLRHAQQLVMELKGIENMEGSKPYSLYKLGCETLTELCKNNSYYEDTLTNYFEVLVYIYNKNLRC